MRNCVVALVLLLFTTVVQAGNEILPPDLETYRNKGVTALFNMDYATAKSTFDTMIQAAPDHPAGHIYLAHAIWLGHLAELRRLQTNIYNRGNSFFSKTEDAVDPKIDKAFRAKIDRAIQLCEKKLKTNKQDLSSMYYLGVARNILAGYEATVKRSFMAALRNGSKGVDVHREIIKKYPSCIDAQLSVGMYNYVVGSLPFAVKVLAFIGGVRGSKKDGIAMLERVAKDGNYAKDEAKVLLIMLYNREKRLTDSLKNINEVVATYPSNVLFRLERAVTLGQLKKYPESSAEFDSLLKDPGANGYIPDLIHFQYATMLMDAAQWSDAFHHYKAASVSPKAPPALVTLSILNGGKSLDRAGKREDAIQEYRKVLGRQDVFDSHDLAKKYIKEPFKG